MLNNPQQRKALVLSLLMVMLAQTAYIEAYRGWKPSIELQEEETDVLRVDSPAVCSAASRTSGTEIHVDVVEGNDTYPGTSNCPKASLGAAVTLAASESASNPEIVLHAGLYHENVSVNNLDNLLIRAATGERVVFDGTRSIADDLGGVWGSADSDGIQEVTLTEDGWQLFLDHEEQVPARWPNAGFDDETVFNRSYWAEGTLTNSNNAYTIGWLTDAGPETGVHTGLNETVNATGLDPVGAIAVMNLGSFRSNSRIITDWNPNNGTFAYDGTGVGWKSKHHAYFLEGKRELIDQDGEWWFNNTNNRLHYKAPSGQDANNLDLRVKVQPFAISVEGSDGVTIQGIDFFGTTVNFNNCDGCSFTNATLEYPSTSKRGLGIAGESEDDRWMTRFYRSKNSFVDNISITNTDGGAIEFQGSPGQSNNNTVNNSYFHAIDWSAADQKGLMVTIYEGGRDMYFTNNTVHLTGASSVLSIGDAPKVFYNEVWDVGHLQTDGAVVQVMQAEAPGAEIAYNWIHDIIKYGARFDAPIGQAGEGRNGTMHHNVIWNAAGGLMVKGDYHNIHNNTVFNSSGKNDMIILTDNGVNNGNSTIHQNAADKMADHRSDSWSLYPLPAGTFWNNWNGYVNTTDSVWNQLVDPANRDFRPKANSHLDNMSAGAYDAGVSNPWTAGISWTYTTPSAPVAGCMLDYADNYDADATLSDGSCLFASYTPPSTLDLRLHLDPTNSSSYSGSGTNVADLSGFNNNGTVASAGPTWDADFTRFTYDGACTGSGPYVCDEIEIEDSETLRPGEPYEDLAVELNQGSTTQYLAAPTTLAGYTLGAVETSFTIQAWVKPTDCENPSGAPTILSKVYSFKIGCDDGTWQYVLGNGAAWYTGTGWVDTDVPADNDVWQHVALTRASSSTGVKFFLNGVQSYSVSSYEGDLGNNNNQPLYVGSRSGQYATSDAWHGLIDDVRIYTSDRTSTIAVDMNGYPNVDDQYLNAFFDFNLERDDDTITGISNIATGANASSSSLTSVTGSPKVVRTWDVSTSGSDTILTFERTVLTAQGGWRVPAGVSSAETMVVGGGGGGGYNTGGGGGGGGVEYSISTTLTSGSTMTVVVGQGGQGSTASSSDGANGTFSQLGTTVVGGGGGGASWTSSGADGADAPTGSPAFTQNGSGGGASNANGAGGTGAKDGGNGATNAGGGGGGAGQDGSDASSSTSGGGGGFGIARASLTGSLNQYGSGGGGGSWNNGGSAGSAASGGSGAGDGGNANSAASHGTHHRGGGGGGGGSGSNTKDGGNGGSGIVIVRFASVDHNDWSVATWFNASSLQGSTIIGTYDDNGQASDIGWALRIRAANGNLYSTVGPTTNNSAAWTSDASIDTNRWYHVVMVADVGNTLRLYLDGVNVANGSLSGSVDLRDVSNNVFLGSYNGGEEAQPFDGQIGSVMVFADALNASNIDQLYTAGKGVYSNTTNLSYAQSSSTMLLGQTYSFPITVANGEVTTSYSLSGTLPSGMNFESSNGTIWGTPTATMTSTTYTVTANNSAGSYSTSISLTSQHVAPYDLVYSPENMTLEKGTAMTTNTPSVSGGTITSWEISPSVPTGLSFSTSTGAISGTPSVLQTTATMYTVWANNSGGSTSAQVNITINDEAPDIAYSPDWFVLTNNTAMQATTPTNSGGAIPSAFFGYTGDAKATSIAVDSSGHKHVSYRDSSGLRYATDASGSWVTVTVDTASAGAWNGISSIAIDSNDVLHISYNVANSADLKYATCSSSCTTASNWNNVSIDTSGAVGYYTSIALDSNDALHISYFDDTNKDLKYATCSSGCTTASNWNIVSIDTSGAVGYYTSIALDSNDALHISYFDDTNTNLKYATCSSSCTTASNWNAVSVDSFGSSIFDPEVRTDLAIDSNDGVHLSYFDNTNDDLKYATCSSGCTTASNWNKVSVDTTGDVGYSASIGIDSNDGLHISYSDKTNNNLNYATCSNACTTASNWNNETVDSSSVLTGEYTSIAIDTNDVIHISYFDDTKNKIKYLALDSSSNILGYSVSPDLPTGLRLDPMIGKISGTPTELSTNTTYTITVRNSGGVNTTTITIQVNDQVPNALGYTPENMTLDKGTTMTTNTPSVSGGAVTSWEIDPSLPSGLSFGSTNGSIWGTPTILQTTAVAYTIWANNSGGSTSAQVNITINDQIASISYSTPVEISNNRLLATITPTTSGGAITTWEITPALPTGLTFGTTNGSIWGTPENVTSNATYTIYANNSGGSASAALTFNVNWTLTPIVDGVLMTRNASIGTNISWEWDYDPLEGDSLSIVTGEFNTCAIKNNGDVYCWGRNGNGQIGNGQISQSNTACGVQGHKCKDVPTLSDIKGTKGYDAVGLAFGDRHACALLDDGSVMCWGRNNAGQIGVPGGDQGTPQSVNLGTGRTAKSIHAGGHYSCAILDDDSVKCWGQNDQGQLGIGTFSNTNTPTTVASFGTGRTAVTLATAFKTACALLDDGSVKCWGDRSNGLLGNGGGTTDLDAPPASSINLGSGRTAKAITGGKAHFCVILDDDSIKCWGEGANGKLGTGSTGGQNTPTSTSGSFGSGRYAVAIDAGYQHTCVILDNGALTCWGGDGKGQLGNGAVSGTISSLQSSTVNLGAGRTAISLSAGGEHTCAQLDNDELMCWGNRGDGQVGDNGGFSNPSDRTSPVSVNGGHTYLDTGVFPSSLVADATCGISPALPTGLSLISGTCIITGTPTVTAVNTTYTVWANISGLSFSGQVWLEVGLNLPIVSYSPATYTYTKDSTISTIVPSNTGGEIATWAINGTLPSGLFFGTSNGSIWGTPDAVTPSTTYTVWANNSAGSASTTITFTTNDIAPSITFSPSFLMLAVGTAMTSISVSNSGGTIVSCNVSPSLPAGLSLSNTCVLSGTPTVVSSNASYTITATNTGGSDTATFSLTVQASGGTLTITPANREGSGNSPLANITMSYTHTASNYGWTSGVSNTTTSLATNFDYGRGVHWLGADSGEQGELVVVYARKDSTTTTHSLAMLYRWNGAWTETILDNGTNTGHHPSVSVDRQGAIHIAYIDDNNDKLRYATNASGSWVFTTLGNSTIDLDNAGEPRLGRGTAIVVHPITDAVHIVATNYVNSSRGLSYHTNEGGSWVNETITDMTKDEGHDPAMAMDADGNLYVAHYCSSGCADLRLSSRIDGVWQNETVSSSGDIGSTPDIAIDSQGTIHIVSKYAGSNGRVYLHSGTPGSWTENTGLGGAYAYWPVVGVDSNDAVHISYHLSWTYKDVMYMTNASGSWSTPSKVEEYGGWGSVMVIDANDDIFIPNIHPSSGTYDDELQLTTVQGSGQGLTARPIFDISPMLPDGLVMNWRNGTISGTPTEALANTSFTVTVTALGATTSGSFTLFITGAPGIIAYNDLQASNQTAITPVMVSRSSNNTSGDVSSWAISPNLPAGLSFGTTNGSIWGTPTVEQAKTTYTVWANNTAGSSSTTFNITIGPEGPGPFEYNPANNILTNNTEVHLAPVFVNRTTGNGSTWQVADINSGTSGSHSAPGQRMSILVGDTIYFDAFEAATGTELWAYDTSNQSLWQVTDIRSGSVGSNPGDYSSILVGDTLYFSANDGSTGQELWAHNTSNGTTWQVANIRSGSSHSNPGSNMMHVINGVLYFSAIDGYGVELWKHDPSTDTTSRVKDIHAGSSGSVTGKWINMVVGDVLYFSATDGSTGQELWAYNTSNSSDPWRVMDINSGNTGSEPGKHMSVLVGDTIYFDAGAAGGRELWAHNISNQSTWRVVDIHTGSIGSNPGDRMALLVGDTIYFDADDGSTGSELWAHDTSNHSTWRVADIQGGSSAGSAPGHYMSVLVGDTVYFSAFTGSSGHELWAHDTSNHSTWQVAEINTWITMAGGGLGSYPGQYMAVPLGDTIYFSAAVEQQGTELWAHDTSNLSTWKVVDIDSGSNGGTPGYWMEILVGDTLYFSADDGSTGHELWAHRPSRIDYNTNTGGAVASWAISASLPSGVSFDTTNGTIYGTPTELWTKTSYTIWANNSGGSSVAYLNITVVDDVPTLSYSLTSLNLTNNTVSSDLPLSPTLTGPGEITSWALNASLPAGLNFGTSNGTVWGVPTELQLSPVNYTIWANNSGGSTSAIITIIVVDQVPTVAYAPANLNLMNNTASGDLPLAPTLTGSGEFTSWAINASLPTGLSFGANNGTIYGTPTELWTSKAYLVWANNSGGSTQAYLNITVVDQLPTVSYLPSDLTLTNNTVSPDLPLDATLTGPGDILSWALNNTSLPSGISFGTGNGTFYGTPTELWPTTAYMVWANNSGGSSVAYLNLTVVDQLPSLSYSLTALNLTNNTVSADLPLTATLTGPGDILSWAINASLPSGLTFETSNGTIWGTPTELWATTAYTLYANNSGGSAMGYLNITVVDQVPVLSYSPTTLSLINNTAHADLPLAPTLAGPGEITSWTVNASLPAGLNFGTSNGTVWGVPTELQISPVNYTIWANNSGGSASATITITVVDQVPNVAYVPAHLNLTNNTAGGDLPLAPTLTGTGDITSWAINASLPSGLSFGGNNGTFYGTPAELWATTAYTIWANNSGGSTEAYLNITVVDQLPTLTYIPSDLTLTNNTAGGDLPLAPTLTGPGEITSWAINASLPSGLSFGANNGTVYGTPTELWTTAAYTVWANNSGGSAVAYLNITVVDQLPTIAYVPANLTLYNNTASVDLPLNATLTGPGEITSWAIHPGLPNGLTFETSNGTIWGVPTQRLNTTTFTVWANNTGGSSEADVNITVLHQEPMFTYPSYNLTLVNNTAMTPLTATLTGGEITSWEIEPSVPTGLTLGLVNGTVWGTPTVVQNTTMYTVWANNSGGSHAVFVNITVYDPAVSLDYNPENLTLTRNESMTDLHPIYTGIVDNWTIVPSLPAGLTFTDGVIAGTPTVNMTLTLYTVWANNSGGSSSHQLNITVLEPIATLDYNPENMTLVRGTQMTDMVPILSGGMVEHWAIHPALPGGLLFDNGSVSGTPTVNLTTTMFTVWANNTGGSVPHTINLTVLEPSGDLSYVPQNLTLTRGVAMVALSPAYSGGAVEDWSIHPALPAGLNFASGVISGTPTVNMTRLMYTVWANNSGGVASATVNITILEPVVDLLYSPDNLTLMRGTTMSVLTPSVAGGSVETWALVGVLPNGLSFSNGAFSGTPLVNMTQTQYLVYANTTGGSATAWVNITVLEPAVNVSYNPYNLTLIRNETMTTLSPTVSGGSVGIWSITPALPSGLTFDNGVISGTPEVNMTTTMFTVWANTSGGASSTTVNITILEPVVDFIYNPNSLVLTRNESMSDSSPMFGNDANAEEWGISPALPAGLNFTNATVSGTPLVNMTATVFTVYANNSGGTAVAYLTITILEPVATVVYVPENITLTRGEDNASIQPILGGGHVATWSISPGLPEGMVFANGSITGVPLVNSTSTTYTVTALNSGGMAFAFLNITVVEPVAILAFNESFFGTRGETTFNSILNNTGGMVATWSIEPMLPEGVGLWDGWLYGTPLVNMSETTFTIWANNSGGSANLTFTIEVIEPVVIIDYPEAEVTLVNGVTRGRIIPVLDGGVAENWSIEPALPPGLSFVNGAIVGVATTNFTTTTYTVWANNSGGVALATFNLTVNQPTFYARYATTRVVLDINETMPTLTPIYYFGDNQNPVWSIAPALPEGLAFANGRISGTPTEASNETNYTITVLGEMVPVELYVVLEVRAEVNNTVESVRNETDVEQFVLPEPPEPESFDMYWLCFPVLLFLTLLGVAAINNFLALTAKDEDEEEGDSENEGKGDGDGGD